MAVTENLYTGDGSTVLYSFTFPYLNTTDVKVSLDAVTTTAYSLANATQVQLNAAPASGVVIRVFRDTADDALTAEFFPGAAIKASDLNNNFNQNLYVTQESNDKAEKATTTANTAKTTADNATTASNNAVSTANTALTNATNAVNTANTASTNATNAVNVSNTASTNASTALSTANTASTNASTALSTANTADTNATTALNNSRESDGSGGYTTAIAKANTAISTANTASSTATTAATNASAAVTTANSASATATAAQNAVAGAAFYTPVANVAGIPGSPSDNDRIEVGDSTGIQSFSPLTGYPAGFTGSSGLTARIQYSSSGSTWNWVDYFANDPEDRYYTKTSGTTNATNIATKMPLAGGTFSGAVSFDDNVIIKGDSTNGSGKLTLNCENNSHGIHIKGPPHSAGANYTLTLPNDTGTSGQALKTDGSGTLSFADVSSSFITQTDFAYAPSSNTATLLGPSTATNPTGLNKYIGFNASPTSTQALIRFEKSTNLVFYNLVNQLSSGDSIDVNWNNVGNQRTDTTTFSSLSDQTVNGIVYGSLIINSSLGTFGQGNYPFSITSSQITNGVEPIANNQILRYKTATQKWTVDSAEVIAICDGGNFANGSSLVQTSTTFDGGSF